MSETVISVENLSKEYRLGVIGSNTLRDDVARWWANLRGHPDPTRKIGQATQRSNVQAFERSNAPDTLWALKDVSFEVKQGEVVGIIGRNGAGKSALLKILSRITAPTSGHVKVKGRIASLLEVGTGFHPELTGRENIYLNGAILGMVRADIARKFDEIVDFSGVEQFIDTPVKRYSSGMYVRLAFAVAAHLEPEILLVDEVLAVGDAEFQKKCLGKMSDVAHEGRTVLFVSHNMGAIHNLCGRCILLNDGRIDCTGVTETVIARYNMLNTEKATVLLSDRTDRMGTGEIRCTQISFLNLSLEERSVLDNNNPCYIRLGYEASNIRPKNVKVGIGLDTLEGVRLITLYSDFTGQIFSIAKGTGSILCKLETGLNLRPDTYVLHTFIGTEHDTVDAVLNATTIQVDDSNFYGTGKLPYRAQGAVLVKHCWQKYSTATD